MESLLLELQARSPKLTLNLKGGVIYAILDNFSFPVTEGTCVNEGAFRSCQRIAKFYELEQRMINDGYDGRYAIVTADLTVKIVSTEDEAIRFMENNVDSFYKRIGVSDALFFNEFDIDFRAVHFDGLSDIRQASVMTEAEQVPSFAFAGGHRFVKLSVLTNTGEPHPWRSMWFIIDSGSSSSYIRATDRGHLPLKSNYLYDFYEISGLGKKFSVRKSEEANNVNIREFNLIGTNFLDHFVVILDALSRSIMLLKREHSVVLVVLA